MGYCFLYKRGGGGSGGSNRPVVVKTALGSVISLTDSTNGKLRGLRIFGKTTQSGTPSPDAPVPLESVGDDGNVTVFVGKSQTDANPQSATFDTPNGLPGIPVSSGGNYTDENGQIWVCDEIDCDRGVRVQRVCKIDSYSGEAIGDVFLSSTGALTAGATVLYPLATPIETPLSAEELAQYAALHTNYPNTTIFNDEGADMEVKYTSGG